MISHSSPVLIYRLFPQLLEAKWGYLNLNELAKDIAELGDIGTDDNPFLDQEFVAKWMKFIYKLKGIDHSWGGYLEDRSTLWRGHYQKPGECIHLGIDVNVPAGTPVHLPMEGTLYHIFQDPDQNGGWGGKLIFRCGTHYWVFGHLTDLPQDALGAIFCAGTKIGIVADESCNGGWFPHLHVQVMKKWDAHVDGYGPLYDGIEKDFPNPVEM